MSPSNHNGPKAHETPTDPDRNLHWPIGTLLASRCEFLGSESDETIIFGVASDPVPDDVICPAKAR